MPQSFPHYLLLLLFVLHCSTIRRPDPDVFVRAAGDGQNEILRTFLKNGANANAPNRHLVYPLRMAATWGHTDSVMLLLDSGANINAQVVGSPSRATALEGAASEGHMETVKLLLSRGADVNLTAPIVAASANGHTEIVRLLIKNGANVNAQNNEHTTALFEATKSGHIEIVNLLLASGVDVHWEAKGAGNRSALVLASGRGDLKLVKLLLGAGANRKVHTSKSLIAVIGYKDHPENLQREIIRLLLKAGADPNASDHFGLSVLGMASLYKRSTLIKELIHYGADVNAKDRDGRTALSIAREHQFNDIIRMLEKAGAKD